MVVGCVKLVLQVEVNVTKKVQAWIRLSHTGQYLPQGMKGLFCHVRVDRMFGGRSVAHLVLLSIQLQGQDWVIIGFEELTEVISNAEGVPVVPCFGVRSGT